MTYGREIVAYAVAHLGGYVASMVLAQAVLMPMLMAMDLLRTQTIVYAAYFLMYVVVQVAVFFGFIAMRGRHGATQPGA